MKNLMLLLFASVIFISCESISGNGNVKDEKRPLSNINTIRASGSIDVEIANGDTYSLTVEDDENLIPYVVTEVNGGELNIHYKNGYSIMNDHAKVIVTAPTLDRIITSGSGDISTDGVITNNNQIEMNTSGTGDVKATVNAPSIKVTGSGSGDIELSGMTKNFDCGISGSGDIKCSNLKSENAVIHVAGSSDVHVFASVSLKVNVTGSGDVHYSGNPASPEIHITGSGTVEAER
ncbi:MAG TPA: head GIN domain-containing protein [Hanamia sp.]